MAKAEGDVTMANRTGAEARQLLNDIQKARGFPSCRGIRRHSVGQSLGKVDVCHGDHRHLRIPRDQVHSEHTRPTVALNLEIQALMGNLSSLFLRGGV